MLKISKNPNQLPKWLNINRDLVPDFAVIDPKKSPVWEITVMLFFVIYYLKIHLKNRIDFFKGAEFSKSKQHTANGISIRFPRVTKVRGDKTWKEATNLAYLNELFEKSKPSKKDNDDIDDDDDEENLVGLFQITKKNNISNQLLFLLQFHFGDSSNNNNNNSSKNSSPVKRKLLEIDSDDDIEVKAKPAKAMRKAMPNSLLKLNFPNIFVNQYIYLSSSLPTDEYNKLKRHIEAFGGLVLLPKDVNDEKQLAAITHCVGEKDATFDKIDQVKKKIQTNVTHISLPTVYVWKCIANKTKL